MGRGRTCLKAPHPHRKHVKEKETIGSLVSFWDITLCKKGLLAPEHTNGRHLRPLNGLVFRAGDSLVEASREG